MAGMRLNHHGNFKVQRFQLFEQIKKDGCAPPSPTWNRFPILKNLPKVRCLSPSWRLVI